MKFEDRLNEKIARDTGFRVPEGYFEQFIEHTSQSLPERKQREIRLSRWQKVRPYVYLAAMFAGIWCMMKMFHTMSGERPLDLDNPPALVAQAVADSDSDYFIIDGMEINSGAANFELEQDIIESYSSINEFEEDFRNTK